VGGVTTKTIEPIKYRPYLGAGLQIGLSSNIAFTAESHHGVSQLPLVK
jgi:hypothetical protein